MQPQQVPLDDVAKIIASGLRQCVTAQEAGKKQTLDVAQLEKLFLSLA